MSSKKPTAKAPTQKEINNGQRKINGQLCRVDRRLVEILWFLREQLAQLPEFAKVNFSDFDKRLKEIYHISGDVAEIIPPGCEPQYKQNPNWPSSPPPPATTP
jgi:hypothetical protein